LVVTNGVLLLSCIDLENGDESVLVVKGPQTSMVTMLGLLTAANDIVRGSTAWDDEESG
jgi:hypothetical protein